jgi:hypothetical protein
MHELAVPESMTDLSQRLTLHNSPTIIIYLTADGDNEKLENSN